jgi:hypothetical protein
MSENILHEVSVTHEYYREYLKLIHTYENISRNSIFVRYLNINKNISTYNEQTNGTETRFQSGVYFDIYDYTPLFEIGVNVNTPQDRQDQSGFKFDGTTNLVTYTISEPNINDLVVFSYDPHKSEEIFRVSNVSTTLNSRNYNVVHYKLDLEYAGLKTIGNLNIANHFVYLLSQEKNIPADQYKIIVKQVENISSLLKNLQLSFNEKFELYYYVINGFIIAPLEINKRIYSYICNEKFNRRYFDKFKKPFGIIGNLDPSNIGIDLLTGRKVLLNDQYSPYLDINGNLCTDISQINSVNNVTRDIFTLNNDLLSFIG